MVFSGSPFLFYFLPAVLALYFLVPRRLKTRYCWFSASSFMRGENRSISC